MKKRPQKKIGVQKPIVKEVHTTAKEEGPLLRHYGMTQHFKITIQEPDLDDDFEQMKRMFRVIVSNPDILNAVCEFEVLSAMEDTYVSENYGDMNYYIGNILAQFLDRFTEEDQQYIRDFGDEYDSFSILGDCFKSKPDGFQVESYAHVHTHYHCNDCGHEWQEDEQ